MNSEWAANESDSIDSGGLADGPVAGENSGNEFLAGDLLWTVTDVAEYLQCSEDLVRKLVRNDELTAAYVGGRYLFDPDHVKRWLQSQTGKKPHKNSRKRKSLAGDHL